MELIHAVVYGIFQGIFAYLPVSSDAQIRLIQSLVGWQADEGKVFTAFTAVIQVGPTLAVILFLRKDVIEALRGIGKGLSGKDKDSREARLGMGVLIGTIPIIVLGLALQKLIETDFRSLYVIAISLIVGAVIMFFSDKVTREQRTESDVQVKDGIIVGLWQCLALIPGMSRSGCTISGALFQRFQRADAARFAFLLGIPSFSAAGIYELLKYHKQLLQHSMLMPLLVAFVISFVVAYGCLSWFLGFLQKRGVAPFVWYRVILGVIILSLLATKQISGDTKTADPSTTMGTASSADVSPNP